jgi:hypothetical protein
MSSFYASILVRLCGGMSRICVELDGRKLTVKRLRIQGQRGFFR